MRPSVTRLFVVVLLLLSGVVAQTQLPHSPQMRKQLVHAPDVPVHDVDPTHALLLGNSQARVFRVNVAPHATSGSVQHHHDYFIVAIDAAQFTIQTAGRQFAFDMQRGDVQILKGGWPHRVTNGSGNGLHIVEIETTRGIDPEHARCGIGPHECFGSSFGRNDKGSYLRTKIMETASVTVHKVQLDPGVELPEFRTSGDSVIVALTELMAGDVHLQSGDAQWQGPGAHLLNSGTAPAEFVLVEMK